MQETRSTEDGGGQQGMDMLSITHVAFDIREDIQRDKMSPEENHPPGLWINHMNREIWQYTLEYYFFKLHNNGC